MRTRTEMARDAERRFILLLCVFIAIVSILNVISVKIVTVAGLTLSVGSYAYALTYPITDTIAEIWGRRRAQRVVLLGFVANIIVVCLLVFAAWHPPAGFWQNQNAAFREIVGVVPRVMLGSMCAYLLSQLHDVVMFHYWKKKTKSRHLWLRNNLSTAVSQLIDSCVFTLVAFVGVLSWGQIGSIIVGQYIIKIIIAIADTPFVYLLVRWVSGQWSVPNEEEFGMPQ